MRVKYLFFTILFLTGCQKTSYIEGPELSEGSIQSVTIRSLEDDAAPIIIKDLSLLKKSEYLFSKYNWRNNTDKEFTPLYKFTITTSEGKHINYWLGSNSDLDIFPCYKLCSGWWLISSDIENKPNRKIYKSLSASSHTFLVAELLYYDSNQPNKAINPVRSTHSDAQ